MEPTISIALLIALLGSAIGAVTWIRQGRVDSAGLEKRLTHLESKSDSLQAVVNSYNLANVAKMEQQLDNLKGRVEKLDNDVEKKIDQLTDKIDSLMVKINDISIQIANKK